LNFSDERKTSEKHYSLPVHDDALLLGHDDDDDDEDDEGEEDNEDGEESFGIKHAEKEEEDTTRWIFS
jgi:hypothetical protein